MKVQEVLDWLNAFAPFDSAESFDNVGLLIGDPQAQVRKVLFGMDVTEALVREAIAVGADLIITHHPFIFRGLKRIDYTEPQGRTLALLTLHGINVLAAHTNYDKAPGGIGDCLANALGLMDVQSCDDYVRIGTLPAPLSSAAFSEQVRKALRAEPRCYFTQDKPITRVAVAGGSYGEGYHAALAAGADAYVVGEIGYHEVADAVEHGLAVYDAGHYATELPGVVNLYLRFLSDPLFTAQEIEAVLYQKAPFQGALLALQ